MRKRKQHNWARRDPIMRELLDSHAATSCYTTRDLSNYLEPGVSEKYRIFLWDELERE